MAYIKTLNRDTLLFVESKLSIWLNTELQQRGWSERELARRAGLSHTAINNALASQYQTRLDTYRGIARAFQMSLEDVLRAAGELPELPPAVAREEEVIRLFRQVPDTHRDLALRILDVFASQPNQSNPGPADWSQLAPGENVVLRTWHADHPLIQVLESLRGATREEATQWLLEHVTRYGTTAETGERRRPAIESAQ